MFLCISDYEHNQNIRISIGMSDKSLLAQLVGSVIQRAGALILCRPYQGKNGVFDYQLLMMEQKSSPYIPFWKWPHQALQRIQFSVLNEDEKECEKFPYGVGRNLYFPPMQTCISHLGLHLCEDAKIASDKLQQYEEIRQQYINKPLQGSDGSEAFGEQIKDVQSQEVQAQEVEEHEQLAQQLKQEENEEKEENEENEDDQIAQISEKKRREILKLVNRENDKKYHLFDRACSLAKPQKKLQPVVRLLTDLKEAQQMDTTYFLTSLEEGNFLNFGLHGAEKMYSSSALTPRSEVVEHVCWKNPYQILKQMKRQKIQMNQAQFMILNVMSKFKTYRELTQFLGRCNNSDQMINLGANVFEVTQIQQAPYMIPLLGDHEFPYADMKENEDFSEQMREQIDEAEKKYKNKQYKNRITFHTDDLFGGEYTVECTVENSILSVMRSSKELWEEVEANS